MPSPNPEVEGASIVLVGHFNPAILNPDWLAARDLVRQEEAADSDIQAITGEVTVFRSAWLELEVTRRRFAAHTTDPSNYRTLKELVAGIYTFLEYTPVVQMGLNTRRHFRMKSETKWNELGDRLAPKEPWKHALPGHRADGRPGLRTLVLEGLREESASKYVRVTLEPSVRVVPGIYLATNEHYESKDANSPADLLGHLHEAWEPALQFASDLASQILGEQR